MFAHVLYYIVNFEIIALDMQITFAVFQALFAITQLLCLVLLGQTTFSVLFVVAESQIKWKKVIWSRETMLCHVSGLLSSICKQS